MTMTTIILLCCLAVCYIVYVQTIFAYGETLFEKKTSKYKALTNIFCLINAGYLLTVVVPGSIEIDIICMLLYCFIVFIEAYLLYNFSFFEMFFGVLCFAINFFGIRFLVLGAMSLFMDMSIQQVLLNFDLRLVLMLITLFIPIPYLIVFKRIIHLTVIKRTLQTKMSLKVTDLILTLVYINLICSAATVNVPVVHRSVSIVYLMVSSVFPIVIFIIIMFILYLYSKLNDVAEEFEDIIDDISNAQKTVNEMEQYTELDYMTGCFIRSVAVGAIKANLAGKISFAIIYIDLDGLKTVNDRYGHEEGDWYIKTVSDKIRSAFDGDVISRIGGDEFLVVSKDFAYEQVQKCIADVEALAINHNKQYSTSVSVGVNEVETGETLGVEALIAKADEKMYEMKCKKNIQRKI